jgi:hypothetical protein
VIRGNTLPVAYKSATTYNYGVGCQPNIFFQANNDALAKLRCALNRRHSSVEKRSERASLPDRTTMQWLTIISDAIADYFRSIPDGECG